jgi:hypothetical protein
MTIEQMAGNLVASTTNSFTSIVTANLPVIILVAAALIGAGFLWGRFKKHVAGKKI